MICFSLKENTIEKDLKSVSESNASIFELRLDKLKEDEIDKALSFPSIVKEPVILTYRRKIDGGDYTGNEEERVNTLIKLLSGNFSFVDIEEDVFPSLINTLKNYNSTLIVSLHLFTSDFKRGEKFLEKYQNTDYIPKLSIMINSTNDLLKLLELSNKYKKDKMIIVGMGEYGKPCRILYKKFNSVLTYSSKEELAPGMICYNTLKNIYKADKIDKNSEVYGIIGNPVLQSSSYKIHNKVFNKKNLNKIYVPFCTDTLNSFIPLIKILNVKGFSVTSPFKNEIIKFLDYEDDKVKITSSCNTVIIKDDALYGYNTDYDGFLDQIIKDKEKKYSSALILGSGGVASTIICALQSIGVKDILIVGRNEKRLEELSNKYKIKYDVLSNLSKYSYKYDLIVQATTVGMKGKEKFNVAKELKLSGKESVFETIYAPRETFFVKMAKENGCKIYYGKKMLNIQAKEQSKLFLS